MIPNTRAFIRITGEDRVSFLQGLLTQDVTRLSEEKIQFAAMLSPQGKILHDMFLIHLDDAILLDTQAAYADTLLKRLSLYKLRAKVSIEALTTPDTQGAALPALPDPRHPELAQRHCLSPVTCHLPLSLGIPELGRDFAPDSVVALDAGYDLLHAVSFSKGCYVGQEVTARMHYKNIARRGFYQLWREGAVAKLALLRFEDHAPIGSSLVVEGITYEPRLPGWMLPKYEKFLANQGAS
jgi:folate-binding protein YgfZ